MNGILRNKRLLVLYLFTFESIYVIMGMVECLGGPVIVDCFVFGVMLNLNWVDGLGIALYITCAFFRSCFECDIMPKRSCDL